MSYVTNVILVCSLDEPGINDLLPKLNTEYRCDSSIMSALVNVSDSAGGPKAMENDLWIGAFNHFDVDFWIKIIREAKWEFADGVQLLVKSQNEEVFHNIPLNLTS